MISVDQLNRIEAKLDRFLQVMERDETGIERKQTYTTGEVARLLGCSCAHVLRLRRQRKLRAVDGVKNPYRFPIEQVVRLQK